MEVITYTDDIGIYFKTKEALMMNQFQMEVGNLITEDYAGKQSINLIIKLVNNI